MSPQSTQQLSMTQERAIEWLIRLDSPNTTEQDETDFFTWLHASPENQQAYIRAEKMWGSLESLSSAPHTESVSDAHHPTSGEVHAFEPRQTRRTVLTGFALAASFLLATIFIGSNFLTPNEASFSTVVGQQKNLTLSDGSKVVLNTNSQLEFVERGNLRLAKLAKGEAFFSVTHRNNQPFIIETPNGIVRVLGTRFSVKAESGETLVTVLEGKVGVAANTSANQVLKQNLQLDATLEFNQQLSLHDAELGIKPKQIDAHTATSWRNGTLIYDGTPLSQVVSDLSRYHQQSISLADPQLHEINVVAVLDIKDMKATLYALQSAFNLKAKTHNEEIFLYQKK